MRNLLCSFIAILAAAVASGADFAVKVAASRESAIFLEGEKVAFSAEVTCKNAPTSMPLTVTAMVPGQLEEHVISGAFTGADGRYSASLEVSTPGWVYITVSATNSKGRVVAKGSAGAMYRPDDIRPALPVPADFKAFWDKEIEELGKVPINPRLTPFEIPEKESCGGKIRGYEFALDCTGPYPATGFVALPVDAKPKSLPIIVGYQGASGIRAWKPWYYADVAISLSASKYGLPNTLTDSEYAAMGFPSDIVYKLAADPALTREENFFKWMILRDLRIQQFAKTFPEWNGKVMLVNGESLGGAQALICGALDPDVTFISACVPALSDHNAFRAGRRNGWPHIWKVGADGKPAGETEAAQFEAARYFDTANFCSLIATNKEVTVGVGFLDIVCPPDGVYAAFNSVPAGTVKRMSPRPLAGHGAGNAYGGVRIREILGK